MEYSVLRSAHIFLIKESYIIFMNKPNTKLRLFRCVIIYDKKYYFPLNNKCIKAG